MKANCENCMDYEKCLITANVLPQMCSFYTPNYSRIKKIITVGEAIKCMGLKGAVRYGR